jgi:hypothetical protein
MQVLLQFFNNSMDQRPWETDSVSEYVEFIDQLYRPKYHDSVDKNTPLGPTLGEVHPVLSHPVLL